MENAEPDLIFADIQLSDGVSFEIFERYELKCPVIFTTAYDEYAIRAFKVNGVDYLLKPVDIDDFKRAIDKCRIIIEKKLPSPKNFQELMQVISQPNAAEPVYKEKFVVSVSKQLDTHTYKRYFLLCQGKPELSFYFFWGKIYC